MDGALSDSNYMYLEKGRQRLLWTGFYELRFLIQTMSHNTPEV